MPDEPSYQKLAARRLEAAAGPQRGCWDLSGPGLREMYGLGAHAQRARPVTL